jgi:butyrate kinase
LKILVINPGSTSTKIALYDDDIQQWLENIGHSAEQLASYGGINEQLEMRKKLVSQVLERKGIALDDLSAIAARGGLLPPVKAGAYLVNEEMVDQLINHTKIEHASNLAAPIGYMLGQLSEKEIPVYIYDAVTADEMLSVTKITGMKEMTRHGIGHNLNCRAAFIEYAEQYNKAPKSLTANVVHLGGGITVSLIRGGRIIDIICDDEGPFSPERAGWLPYYQLLDWAMDGEYDKVSLLRKLRNQGGFMSFFNTTDTREVEKRIKNNDEYAAFIYDALILNICKNIAKLAPVVHGKIDVIILTGGMAYSNLLTDKITESIAFIAPVVVIPGENEMRALALGILRVLRGEEEARIYGKNP